MPKPVTIQIHGMTGEGENVSKARQNALSNIERVLAGEWTPLMMIHKGWILFVVRMPSHTAKQWGYKLSKLAEVGKQDVWPQLDWETRADAMHAGAQHLAQNSGTYAGLEYLLSENEIKDLDDYFFWQKAYATAKSEGWNDDACRDRATRLLNQRTRQASASLDFTTQGARHGTL